MNHAARRPLFHPTPRVLAYHGAIEWEELPSLAGSLKHRIVVRGQGVDFAESTTFTTSAWDNTMPASLEPVYEPEPFRETIQGLATRELREPDVFRHFFA